MGYVMSETDLKPGRELDAVIAEKVMGWKRIDSISWSQPIPSGLAIQRLEFELPNFSTDTEAAWQVVETIDMPFHLVKSTDKMPNLVRPRGEKYLCTFTIDYGNHVAAGSDTAPHAICLAALKAVEQ